MYTMEAKKTLSEGAIYIIDSILMDHGLYNVELTAQEADKAIAMLNREYVGVADDVKLIPQIVLTSS